MPPKIAIILVNWNLSADTIECVESLEKMDHGEFEFEIIVVDNASSHVDRARLEAELAERVAFVMNDRNEGFAGGNNAGMQTALERGADYILLLNNDTVVRGDFLSALYAAIKRWPSKTIFTSKILYFDPRDEIWCAGGVVSKRGRLENRGMNEKDRGQYDREEEVDFFSGCAVLLNAKAVREDGFFWELLFMYCEDVELSFRLKTREYKIIYVPTSVVYHKVSGSARGRVSAAKIFYLLRNRMIVFAKYPWTSRRNFYVEHTGMMLRCLAVGIKHCDPALIAAIVRSAWKGVFLRGYNRK
jgi:GT2 family glycosyltransferase